MTHKPENREVEEETQSDGQLFNFGEDELENKQQIREARKLKIGDTTENLRFSCLRCGKCCTDKDTFVNLTYLDILTLAQGGKYTLDEMLGLVGFYQYEEPISEDKQKEMVFPPIKTERGFAYLGMMKDQTGRCIMLGEENRCTIYQHRPLICRAFPFHFSTNVELTQTVLGENVSVDVAIKYTEKAYEYCPGIGGSNPLIKIPKYEVLGREMLKGIAKDKIFIQEWNRAVENQKIEPTAKHYLSTIYYMGLTEQQEERKQRKPLQKRRVGKKFHRYAGKKVSSKKRKK